MKYVEIDPSLFFRRYGIYHIPAVEAIYKLRSRDIPVSYAARLKCYNCGAFKRKLTCPPIFNWSVSSIKNIFRKNYDYVLVIVARSDGTVPWRKMDDREEARMLEKKCGRGLKGVSMGLQTSMHDLMLKLRKILGKALYLIPGPCHRCRVCNIGGKCRKGIMLHSPEAFAIAVYRLLDELGVKYEVMPQKDVVAVSMIFYRKGFFSSKKG